MALNMIRSAAITPTMIDGVLRITGVSCQNPEQKKEDTELADFSITIQALEGEIRLICEKGCA